MSLSLQRSEQSPNTHQRQPSGAGVFFGSTRSGPKKRLILERHRCAPYSAGTWLLSNHNRETSGMADRPVKTIQLRHPADQYNASRRDISSEIRRRVLHAFVGHEELLASDVKIDDGRRRGGRGRHGAPFASDDYLKYDLDGQIRIAAPSTWKTGDQKSLAVEWAPVGAKKCLVARVEILMSDDGAPRMTSFLVEDLDEVLELSD